MIPPFQEYLSFYISGAVCFCALGIWLLLALRGRNRSREKVAELRLVNSRLIAEKAEWQLAKTQLRENEKKYRTLYKNVPDLIFELNSRGELTSVNDSFLVDYSYSSSDVIGKPFIEFVHPEDINEIAEAFGQAQEVGLRHEKGRELRLVDKDGIAYWCELNANMEFDENGNYVHAYGVVRNISNQKQAVQALHESEERYRYLTENISDIIWIADLDFKRFQYVSPSINHIGPGLQDLLLGIEIKHIMIPESYHFAAEILLKELEADRQMRETGNATAAYLDRSVIQQVGFKGLNDDIVWTESSIKFLRDDQKNPTAIFGASRDINERKKVEGELQKLVSLVNNSRDLIILTNVEGHIQFINSAGQRMIGMESLETTNRVSVMDFLSVPDAQRLAEEAIPYVQSQRNWVHRMGIKSATTGESVPIELNVFLINDVESSSPPAIAMVGRDLTEQQEMEGQLRQSQKMESLGTLAGGIAHDFNNILGTIIGYTDLLKDLLQEHPTEESFLEEIQKAGSRASDLVKQIQTFSSTDGASRQPLQLQPILRDTGALITASFPSSIAIQQTIDPECGSVFADVSQIRQIIVNLCTNAAHAMKDKGGTVQIELKAVQLDQNTGTISTLPPGHYACLTIRDSGIGMTDKVKERIFEPFFTTKGIDEGTGLGLSIVHGIIKNHKGGIEIEGAVGVGTTVMVFLPLMKEDEIQKIRLEKSTVKKRERILVVDDEEQLARFYKLALSKLGYDVIKCNSSQKALEIFEAEADRIDLILTDQIMPEMTGTQLCDAIHKIKPETPVLLISGHPQQLSQVKLETTRISGILQKPVKIRVLIEGVQKALAH